MTEREILNKSIADHEKAIAEAKAGLKSLNATFSVGDRLAWANDPSCKRMLIAINFTVHMIDLSDGNQCGMGCRVKDPSRITPIELEAISSGIEYKRYWDNRKQQKC